MCSFEECEKPEGKGGLCTGHYQQRRKGVQLKPLTGRALTAGMSVEERFWAKVDKSGECWIWVASKGRDGYGRLKVANRMWSAHRLSYEMTVGPIPEGLEIDHKCHNHSCVNPAHLSPVSGKQNAENRRGAQRNSKSGVRGVSPYFGRWAAQVGHENRIIRVGTFSTIEEAEAAVIAKRNELFTNNLLDQPAD